jgi:CheY-like chemotaxis protein
MKTTIKNILLVEDSPNDVALVKSALSDSHLANEIIVAEDGEEALDYLYRRGIFANRPPGKPVFIMLDIKMPRMNGIDVLKVIRGDEALNDVPVVMLTSSCEAKDLQECFDSGANSFVVKPVKINSFIDVVKDLGKYWFVINESIEV